MKIVLDGDEDVCVDASQSRYQPGLVIVDVLLGELNLRITGEQLEKLCRIGAEKLEATR